MNTRRRTGAAVTPALAEMAPPSGERSQGESPLAGSGASQNAHRTGGCVSGRDTVTPPQAQVCRTEFAESSSMSAALRLHGAGFAMSGPGPDEVLAAEPGLAPEQSAEVVIRTRAVAAAVGVQADVIGVLGPGAVA